MRKIENYPVEGQRFIRQTVLVTPNSPRGNCTQTCYAVLFDISLQEVPEFHKKEAPDFYWDQEEWLANMGFAKLDFHESNYAPDCVYLASGTTSRGTQHNVLMLEGKLFWDPHPSDEGLAKVMSISLILPRDPKGIIDVARRNK